MKVILQQDVKGQGKKGQMIEVSDGYARNFLLPKKLALPATADNINAIKQKAMAKLALLEKDKAEAQKISEKLSGFVVKIPARAGAGGKLFGSVTSKEISEALSEQFGIDVEKNKITQSEPIKAFGTYEIKCKLGFEITGMINVIVYESK